jgi:hypothetical protein
MTSIPSAANKAQELIELFQSVNYALICVSQLEKLEGESLEMNSYSSEYWWEVRKEIKQKRKITKVMWV